MDGIASKIAIKVGVFLKHRDLHTGARQQISMSSFQRARHRPTTQRVRIRAGGFMSGWLEYRTRSVPAWLESYPVGAAGARKAEHADPMGSETRAGDSSFHSPHSGLFSNALEDSEQRKLAAIMFTDMVGYSALAQRSETLALELLAENQRLQRSKFALFNGREVKTIGDDVLVEFPSALDATQCAVEIQRTLAARNGAEAPDRHIKVRIGVHVGDVVHREADMYGDGVNIAARIEPLAVGGGICLSDSVYAQVRNKMELGLTKLNSPELKHIEVPVDVYRVTLPWEQPASVATKATPASRTSFSVRAAVLGFAALLALAGAVWWFRHQPAQAAKQAATLPIPVSPGGASDQKSVAVLPFVNMSADKNDEYLSDGVSEELITALSKITGLQVKARTSSFAFKDKNEDIQKIGELLHVNYLLEGSVAKAGNRLRITAQLIQASDGNHLWSDTYDREMQDIFAVRSGSGPAGGIDVENPPSWRRQKAFGQKADGESRSL